MKDLFKNTILDYLYEIRREDFVRKHNKQYGETEESKNAEKAETELVNFMKNFIETEENIKELMERINIFETSLLDEMTFWHRPYYKLGFIDGMNLKKQIEEGRITENSDIEKNIIYKNTENSFFYQHIDSIREFIEYNRFNFWKNRNSYKGITTKMKSIKDKYPNVRTFIDEQVVIELTKEELTAVLDYINLDKDLEKLESLEIFKLGIKEGFSL